MPSPAQPCVCLHVTTSRRKDLILFFSDFLNLVPVSSFCPSAGSTQRAGLIMSGVWSNIDMLLAYVFVVGWLVGLLFVFIFKSTVLEKCALYHPKLAHWTWVWILTCLTPGKPQASFLAMPIYKIMVINSLHLSCGSRELHAQCQLQGEPWQALKWSSKA